MRYLPPMPRTFPATTTCARSSSTPDEHDATAEDSARLRMTSLSAGIVISPSAAAMPRGAVPLDTSMDSPGFSVQTLCPRLVAARIRWVGHNGGFLVAETTRAGAPLAPPA